MSLHRPPTGSKISYNKNLTGLQDKNDLQDFDLIPVANRGAQKLFKVPVSFSNLLALVTATPKKLLTASIFTRRLQRIHCSCATSFLKSSSIKFYNLKRSY